MIIDYRVVLDFRNLTGFSLVESKHFLTMVNSPDIIDQEELFEKAKKFEFNSRKPHKLLNRR